ncbi:NUDIX hydrolase [Aeromicrobium phragmitis]|uniref:NUDIX hydrolase n=1 Tax=Aeromicrobium phragmitis TaxID=2478914 RepID=A0A3L8PQ18_9ACTN|nr:NUDIX hydrolase [Aeromicrobium phragmitis]RLV57476.1 NUDIX hydrolase [Aeromicrobium phragmitis]
MLLPLPERLREHAHRASNPVPPRDAATIAVVRDGAQGIEAFLMRRQASMAFAAGMYVFPGGGVHESDREPVDWIGPSAAEFAARLGCDADLAHALVVAAVRETFEETGVLLAGPGPDTVYGDTTGADMLAARDDLEAGRVSFAHFLEAHGLVLRADLIGVWAHWITPAFEPRRYDTRFFVAALPEGQAVGQISTEADRSLWAPLCAVLERVDAGDAAMMPPTAVTCRELAQHTAETVLAAAALRVVTPIEPRIVEVDGELFLETDRGEHV